MRLKREFKITLLLIMFAFLAVFVYKFLNINQDTEPELVSPVPVEPESKPEDSEEISIIQNPNSITVLVNKKRYLPKDYVPYTEYFPTEYAVSEGYEARVEVVDAYIRMVDAMESETGLWMYVTSSYRGFETQERLFNSYVEQHGEEEALRFVAIPGTSEHQSGLVVDVVTPQGDMFAFGETEQSEWVKQNAHRFGFVVRYEEAFEELTGYMAEPWHLRFLGEEIALKVFDSKRPFDEYYNDYIKKPS